VIPEQPPVLAGLGVPLVEVWTLGIVVAAILVLPKVLILIRGALDGENRRFGGTPVALLSVLGEIALSTVLAPTMLLLQSRAVAQVLLGLDGGWPPTGRGQNWVSIAEAFRASWWIVALATLALGSTLAFAPSVAVWVAPAMLPAMIAPLLISATSRPSSGNLPLPFRTEIEITPPSVLAEQRAILTAWTVPGVTIEPEAPVIPVRVASHVPA
jgi:membrane glycosyltransferase